MNSLNPIKLERQEKWRAAIVTIMLGLVLAALLLVIASIVTGVISMAQGGEYDRKHATHFMFARIGFQALAVLLLMQLAYLHYV